MRNELIEIRFYPSEGQVYYTHTPHGTDSRALTKRGKFKGELATGVRGFRPPGRPPARSEINQNLENDSIDFPPLETAAAAASEGVVPGGGLARARLTRSWSRLREGWVCLCVEPSPGPSLPNPRARRASAEPSRLYNNPRP